MTSVWPSVGLTAYAAGLTPDSSQPARKVRQTPDWAPIWGPIPLPIDTRCSIGGSNHRSMDSPFVVPKPESEVVVESHVRRRPPGWPGTWGWSSDGDGKQAGAG